jgi:hypothetical protein
VIGVAVFVEHTLAVGLFRRSPGMAIAGLYCVRHGVPGLVRIGMARATLRGILRLLIVPELIPIGSRGLHDVICGSTMVSSKELFTRYGVPTSAPGGPAR